jgi:hypothetical protein
VKSTVRPEDIKTVPALDQIRPMDDDEALKWIVAFSRVDFDGAHSPGFLVDLEWNLFRFVKQPEEIAKVGVQWATQFSIEEWKELQDKVRTVLRSLSVDNIPVRQETLPTRCLRRRNGKLDIWCEGIPWQVLVGSLMDLLVRIDIRLLGRCIRCDSVFVGRRGQRYCGRNCANAAAAEAYRKSNRQRIRQKAKTTYKKKRKQELGARVRVGRKEGDRGD